MRAAQWLTVASMVVASSAASGEEPRPIVTLVYTVEPRVTGCPEEHELKNAVSARLGYDPFQEGATRAVEVRIARDTRERSQRGLRAHVGLRVAGGKERGSRDLVSRRGDCGELASSLTLAISIAIDPLALSSGSEPPPPAPPPRCPPVRCPPPTVTEPVCPPLPPPPACPPPPEPPQVKPERAARPVSVRVGVGGVLSKGISPSVVAGGITVRGGFQVGAFSLDLEGRFEPASQQLTAPSRGLETTLLLASLAPCYHYRWVAFCGVVGAGVIRGTGVGVDVPASDQSAFAVAGGRVALEAPLYRMLHLVVSAEGLAHLTQVTFRLNGEAAYTTWPGSLGIGVGLLGKFP